MPDARLKPQVYRDERPAEYFQPFHQRVRAGKPELVYELVRVLTTMFAVITFRARSIGSDNVPNGPLIIAPNHASFMDHFFTGAFIRRRVQFMAKSQLFKPGPMQWIYTHGGVFPVRRGAHDQEAFDTAFKVLERSGTIGMYCEGGRTRTGKMADAAKPGIGRLALESGAAVVPVAILDSHRVRNWKRLEFPRVTVRYGLPLRFQVVSAPTRDQQQAAADLILERIREMHEEMERLGHRGALRMARRRGRAVRPGIAA